MKYRPPTQQGFTLLELIVAVSILAVIAVLSWRGLDAVLHTRDSLNLAQERIDELQRSFNRFERDAFLAREVRLLEGGRIRLLAANDTAVEYRLEGESLLRQLLNTGQDKAEQQVMLDQVTGLQAEAYKRGIDGSAAWSALPTSSLPTTSTAFDGSTVTQPVGPPPAATEPAANAATDPPASPPRFGVPQLPGIRTGRADINATPPGMPAPDLTRQSAPTGLRITVQLKQGGTIQRLFLIGSPA